ncbi:unnamed protein product [Peniophora sp. CBMAI 1063]|nr:unnamed protein product [Peniophora sp. CBMAI 1063]
MEEQLDALEIELCDVKIAAQKAEANVNPPAEREIAQLHVQRVQLQLDRLRRIAAGEIGDPVLYDLQLELLVKRIECATCLAKGAPETDACIAGLEVDRAALRLRHYQKRTVPASSYAPSHAADGATPAPGYDGLPAEQIRHLTSAPSVDPAMNAAASTVASRLPSPVRQSHPPPDAGENSLPTLAPAPDILSLIDGATDDYHTKDDLVDSGDVEQQLIGADVLRSSPLAVDSPRSIHTPAPCVIDIDDDGNARDVTPAVSSSPHVECKPKADTPDEDSVAVDDNKYGTPSELASRSSTPTKTSSNSLPRTARTTTASTRKNGGPKEPSSHPERWACRVFNFGAGALRESADWSQESCHLTRDLWVSVTRWESVHAFENGAVNAPGLPSIMKTIVSKARFGPKYQDVLGKDPDFPANVGKCLQALRAATVSDAMKAFGAHGLAAVARALLELRNANDAFDDAFVSLASELIKILDVLADFALNDSNAGAEDDTASVSSNSSTTVFATLDALAGYDITSATLAIEELQGRQKPEKPARKGHKRRASQMEPPRGSSSKRARRSPDSE